MTAPDYSAMSDAQLNADAGRLTGILYMIEDGHSVDFDPANDLNHASEFGAAFLEKFPEETISVLWVPLRQIWRIRSNTIEYDHASEARARTVAVLVAWAALNG